MRTVSFALVDALDDASVNLNVELGGHKPAGKTSAAHLRAEESTIHPVDSGGFGRLVDSAVDWWTR